MSRGSEETVAKKRVLFVNRSYWPDAEATGQLLTDLCESLVDRFDVSVLCGQPNSNPTGEAYRKGGTQTRRGVTIHRLNHTRFDKRGGWRRAVNLVSFTLAARRWLRMTRGGRGGSGGVGHYDAIVSETDPFLLPIVVAPHAKRVGAVFIAYLQDIYPDIAIGLGKAKPGFVTDQIRDSLRQAYQTAEQLIVLSPAMRTQLIRWGLPAAKLSVIPNWVDCEAIRPIKRNNPFRERHGWADSFIVMHSGNMGLSQRLECLVQCVDSHAFPAHAKLVLVGGGAEEGRLREQASRLGRRADVHFLPYQPREKLSESLSAADLHVISVDPRIGGSMMPSKLYGILASATPTLAVADPQSDLSAVISEHRIGRVAPVHDPHGIAQCIAEMASLEVSEQSAMQRRARSLAESQYDRSICVSQFADALGRSLMTAGTLEAYEASAG